MNEKKLVDITHWFTHCITRFLRGCIELLYSTAVVVSENWMERVLPSFSCTPYWMYFFAAHQVASIVLMHCLMGKWYMVLIPGLMFSTWAGLCYVCVYVAFSIVWKYVSLTGPAILVTVHLERPLITWPLLTPWWKQCKINSAMWDRGRVTKCANLISFLLFN